MGLALCARWTPVSRKHGVEAILLAHELHYVDVVDQVASCRSARILVTAPVDKERMGDAVDNLNVFGFF
jgi:hypothetical protein